MRAAERGELTGRGQREKKESVRKGKWEEGEAERERVGGRWEQRVAELL